MDRGSGEEETEEGRGVGEEGRGIHVVNVLTTSMAKVLPPFGSFWLRCNFIKIK